MQIKNRKKIIIICLLSLFLFNLNLSAEEFDISAKELSNIFDGLSLSSPMIFFIEQQTECSVKIISVGPQRHETILR